MIVVDASAALSALLNAGPAREALAGEQVHAPHLIDPEIANGLRRQVASRALTGAQGWAALRTWQRLGLTRYPMPGLLDRIWQLRENLSAHDASYVALAEGLNCALVTADARLSRSPGIRCPVTVLPR
ncbi:MAG: type II toxin-antitoxin system VapC family toxin [Jatrophihabitans sp.]